MTTETSTPVVPVILSGGAGTRLWPLSRETAPKPFMPLPDGETLLAKTVQRATSLPGVAGLVTVTNRDYYFRTKDVYAGLGAAAPRDATYLLEPFGRNTAPAVALAALLVQARHGSDAVMLVLAADHLIRDQAAFGAAVAVAAALAREGRLVTFGITPDASGNRLRLHRVRRHDRRTRFRRDTLRRKAATRAGTGVRRRRKLCVEFGHVRVHRRQHPRELRALCPCGARGGRPGLETACGAIRRRCSRDRRGDVRRDAVHLHRLCGHGTRGGRRQRRGRARRFRLERRRVVAVDIGAISGRRTRQPRQRRARRHRHARHVHPFRGSHRRHDRRRESRHRRHARRRAGRAQGSPAAGQGRRRGTEGARPRFLQAAQDRRATVGNVHGARGWTRLQDEAHRGQARRLAVAAAASPPQRALGRGARHGARHRAASASTTCRRASRRSFRSRHATGWRIAAPKCSRSSKWRAATTSTKTTSSASTTSTDACPRSRGPGRYASTSDRSPVRAARSGP